MLQLDTHQLVEKLDVFSGQCVQVEKNEEQAKLMRREEPFAKMGKRPKKIYENPCLNQTGKNNCY